MDEEPRLSCGVEVEECPDVRECIKSSKAKGFGFVVLQFLAATDDGDGGGVCVATDRADLTMQQEYWSTIVFARLRLSPGCDSADLGERRRAESALLLQLNYAKYLSVPAVIIPLHARSPPVNLARIVNAFLLSTVVYLQIWVELPICYSGGTGQTNGHAHGQDTGDLDSWKVWNKFLTFCSYNRKISVALRLTSHLPDCNVVQKWLSVPVSSLVIGTEVFLMNKQGFPVLPKSHQSVFETLTRTNKYMKVVVTGNSRLEKENRGLEFYYKYLNHLWKQKPSKDAIEQFSEGYENHLQVPLQPLQDNLESQTYDVFEKDPVKYRRYQEAVEIALRDKLAVDPERTIMLMVLGAGRGPLVRKCLRAFDNVKHEKFEIFAVEKNPNACVTLKFLKKKLWDDRVTLVMDDMRNMDATEHKADIIVSELLGSFGDNELSPECLDGANRLLKEDCISIPCSYTSHIMPVSSHLMHSQCLTARELDKPWDACLETPYVVRLVNYEPAAEKSQPLFSFSHPNKSGCIDNRRQDSKTFVASSDTVVHGIAGYFDTVLYKEVTLSIVPETHSPGMFSWFPLYFPLKQPVDVSGGEHISVHFWRCVDKHKVWYEWCLTGPRPTPIHNPGGRSYSIGL